MAELQIPALSPRRRRVMNIIDVTSEGRVIVETWPCMMCSKSSTVEMGVYEAHRWINNGVPIQMVFPDKTPEERELLISGTHAECWTKMFPPEEDED